MTHPPRFKDALEDLARHNVELIVVGGVAAVLGAIGQGRTYDDLLPDSLPVDLGGITVHVLGLAAVIRTKEEADRDKDRAVLDILRRTLRGSTPR